MDNNYKEGNTLANNYPFTAPYAQGGGMRLRIDKIDHCEYLASFGYVVAAGGATATITAITGHDGPDLDFYRVEFSDGLNEPVANSLDKQNPTNPFIVNTSSLDSTREWTMSFFGNYDYQTGEAGCRLDYCRDLGKIAIAGGSGNTIPTLAKWENVAFRLMLTSTNDPELSLFPAGGVEIKDGETININDYATAQLTQGSATVFSLQMKRLTQAPMAAQPTLPTNTVWLSFVDNVTFPWAVPKRYAEAINTMELETSNSGVISETMTILVPGEGTKPSVSFTTKIDVA
jgi:hypothetical protein